MIRLGAIVLCSACYIAASSATCASEEGIYTIYRNSAIDPDMRIHVASFDTEDGAAYNQENCQIAASLFRSQPGVTVSYWCEPGRYRK
jgi:hypothetical protein